MKAAASAAAVSILALAACAPRTPPASATGKLDCPMTVGDLTRLSAAADGKSCVYQIKDGPQFTLSLLQTPQGAEAALSTLESQLKAEAGMPTPQAAPGGAQAAPAASSEAQRVIDEAAADARGDDDWSEGGKAVSAHVEAHTIHAPGVVVTESKDGDHAKIDLPGIHIQADDDNANVQVGPIHIKADNGVAIIKVLKETRLRGEAFSRQKNGIRATFLYAGDRLSGPYKYVGYEASGPKKGPLVIAVVKSTQKGEDSDHMYEDVKRLVRRNGGA